MLATPMTVEKHSLVFKQGNEDEIRGFDVGVMGELFWSKLPTFR